MHLNKIILHQELFPTIERYPFNLEIFHRTKMLELKSAVTFFVGENGSGKSTLLKAICRKCGVHIWEDTDRIRFEYNPYELELQNAMSISWINGKVPGSFFGSQIFQNFSYILDEWAVTDPKMFDYFGGKSLITQSHGQSLMSYFKSRYKIKGIYFMDEPETALSPKSQLELLKLLQEMGEAGHAQFIIASHSPILLGCPGAVIYNFDEIPVKTISYEHTQHYQVYREFLLNRHSFLSE